MANDSKVWEAAQTALDAYTNIPGFDAEDPATSLIDLIADLMHLADYKGVDGESLANRAMIHYLAEKNELDGSVASSVALLTGFSRAKLDELGGVEEPK